GLGHVRRDIHHAPDDGAEGGAAAIRILRSNSRLVTVGAMSDSLLPPSERTRALWARTRLQVWPEWYRLVSFPPPPAAAAASLLAASAGRFCALVLERDEMSLTVAEDVWRSSPLKDKAGAEVGPLRAITFSLALDLDVVGYLAPAAARLAAAGISIVPQ